MKYLVDSNVLSEPTKPNPAPAVIQWLNDHEDEIGVDPIILGEVQYGIHIMPVGKRRRRLERWFTLVIQTVPCLPWEAAIGIRWGQLLADLHAAGRSMSIKDSMIAATALFYDLTIATRNEADVAKAGLRIVNPFRS